MFGHCIQILQNYDWVFEFRDAVSVDKSLNDNKDSNLNSNNNDNDTTKNKKE